VDIRAEGPFTYRRELEVPQNPAWLVFDGVSYEAQVWINGAEVFTHRGIWDAFAIDLRRWRGRPIALEVRVTKNGGQRFPVRDVASGFLPYVYQTFGGIFRPVRLVESADDPTRPRETPRPRYALQGQRITADGKPLYPRGTLTWGWYPEVGAPHPTPEIIYREIELTRKMGFNLIKFCLWIPPHEYLTAMAKAGLHAWIELPLWAPRADPGVLATVDAELRRIIRQYRHHPNVLLWTVGCETGGRVPAEQREALVRFTQAQTGCPLVRDDSGGAEMYGGDPREYGSFDDFHPYGEPMFYPVTLDSLLPGPRPARPILLGEFNDIDVLRDPLKLAARDEDWASPDPARNDQGVRWQYDLPRVLSAESLARWTPERVQRVIELGHLKAVAQRKWVQEAVRARSDIRGYVVTGWRDTPISTAGFVDDDLAPRFTAEELATWNQDDALFLILDRRPPWVAGGNRPGWQDPLHRYPGGAQWRVGLHSTRGGQRIPVQWEITDSSGHVLAQDRVITGALPALEATQVAVIHAELSPGAYQLTVSTPTCANRWPIAVRSRMAAALPSGWQLQDDAGRLSELSTPDGENRTLTLRTGAAPDPGFRGVWLADREGTSAAPFWREAAYEWINETAAAELGLDGPWERFLPVAGDSVLTHAALNRLGTWHAVLNRIDTRTFNEAPVIAVAQDHTWWATTLRPDGGLGVQPFGTRQNPVGGRLLTGMIEHVQTG